jgi:hypothetical protein
MRISRSVVALVVMVWMAVALSAPVDRVEAASLDDAAKKSLEKALKNRGATARIDLPIRKGMKVSWDGRIDLAVYREKLDDFPVSIRKHERATIRFFDFEKKSIRVVLNGGGMGKMQHRGHLRWIRPEQYNQRGTTIVIDYGRPLTTADLDPDKIAYALRDVITIDGFEIRGPRTPAIRSRNTVAASASASAPVVRLVAVEVIPSRVRRGATVELMIRFEVKGAGPDGATVTESRQVLQGETGLFSEPKRGSGTWQDGLHSSSFEMVVPTVAAPGYYRFVGGVVIDGTTHSRDSIFEVLPD